MRTVAIALLGGVVHNPLLFVGGLVLVSIWVFATIVTHAHYDPKDYPRVWKIGYSLGRRSHRGQALAYYV
jgi:hypothetical protein